MIQIKALSSELLGDYLRYFDNDAFSDNPRWASCYCHFSQAPHKTEKWSERTADQNRAAVSKMIAGGLMCGYLAYDDGKPV